MKDNNIEDGTFLPREWPQLAEYKTGYFVSLNGYETVLCENIVSSQNILDILESYRLEALRLCTKYGNSAQHVGKWTSDGKIYIDISVHINSLENALLVGRHNNQKAIWDIANNQAINL